MKIVIDTNRIIAALLRDSTSRRILFDTRFELFAPEATTEEILRHRTELEAKSHLSSEQFNTVLQVLFEKITIISRTKYRSKLDEARKLISDHDDAPFLALAIVLEVDAIWSDDKVFLEQTRISILTTAGMMKIELK